MKEIGKSSRLSFETSFVHLNLKLTMSMFGLKLRNKPKIPFGFYVSPFEPGTLHKRSRDALLADIHRRMNKPESAFELENQKYLLKLIKQVDKKKADKARKQRAEERTRKAEEFIQKEREDRMRKAEEKEEFIEDRKHKAQGRKQKAKTTKVRKQPHRIAKAAKV